MIVKLCDTCRKEIDDPYKIVELDAGSLNYNGTYNEKTDFCCPACFYQYCRDVLKII